MASMAQEQRGGGSTMGEGSAASTPSSLGGTLGCFLISSPQPSHPEPHGQTYFPARLNAIHIKHEWAGGGGGVK